MKSCIKEHGQMYNGCTATVYMERLGFGGMHSGCVDTTPVTTQHDSRA